MTNEYSFENNACSQYVKELCALYRDRGIRTQVNEDALEQERNEAKTRNIAPSAYHMSYMMDGALGERFRNGSYNGQKYMTSDDFVAYFNKSRRYEVSSSDTRQSQSSASARRSPAGAVTKTVSAVREESVTVQRAMNRTAQSAPSPSMQRKPMTTASHARGTVASGRVARPAVAAKPVARATAPSGSREPFAAATPIKKSGNEMVARAQEKSLKGKVLGFVSKWFPMELRANRAAEEKRRVPVGALAMIATMSISLMLIVGSHVMVNNASAEFSRLKAEESELRAAQVELTERLEEKNDPTVIRDLAVNRFGMVNRDYVSAKYMDLASEDEIVSYADQEREVGLSALLSAIASGH